MKIDVWKNSPSLVNIHVPRTKLLSFKTMMKKNGFKYSTMIHDINALRKKRIKKRGFFPRPTVFSFRFIKARLERRK